MMKALSSIILSSLRASLAVLLMIVKSSELSAQAIKDQPLPDLAEDAYGILSPHEESLLGTAWLSNYRRNAKINTDPMLFEYVEDLLYDLASHSELNSPALNIVLIDNPTLNAFAVPGQIIGIHTGLFEYAQNEAQLAAVLAHEIAHLSQHHFARRVADARTTQLLSMLGLIAGAAIAVTSDSDAGTAAILSTQAAALQTQLNYSRQHEKEADRLGISTLYQTGFQPEAAAGMFEQMLKAKRLYGQQLPEFLLTHPVTESRISDARNRARQLRENIDEVPPIKSRNIDITDFQIMKARIRIASDTPARDKIKDYQALLQKEPDNAAYRYGLAIAYSQAKSWLKARDTLKPLIFSVPGRIAYTLADIEIDIGVKELTTAERRLRDLYALNPDNYAVSMMLSRTLMLNKHYQDAQTVLTSLARRRPMQPDIWYLLAEVHGLANDIPSLHEARAEYFLLMGLYDEAKKHLNYALKLKKNAFQAQSRIKERIKEIVTLQQAIKSL